MLGTGFAMRPVGGAGSQKKTQRRERYIVHPTAHLIHRLARDVESDDLLDLHVDRLQTRLCTNTLLGFFRNNPILVRGGYSYTDGPRNFCVDTNRGRRDP